MQEREQVKSEREDIMRKRMVKKNAGKVLSICMLAVLCTENSTYIKADSEGEMILDMSTDTDKDGYSDYLETTIYGTDPNVSDVTFYRWNQDYIHVDYQGNERWKNYDGTTKSYGGSQMWFYDDTRKEEPDKKATDYIVQTFGCGLIAISDVLLYLAQSDEAYQTKRTNQVLFNENGTYNYESYLNYVYGINKSYLRIINNYGSNKTLLTTGLGAYSMCNNLGLTVQWCSSKKRMLPRIIDMLEQDIPVPLCISYNEKGGGVHFYDWRPTESEPFYFGVKNYKSTVEGHFVVVTGLLTDKVKNQTILEISSWGRRYYVNYDEFLEYVNNYSNYVESGIAYIKK